MRKLWFTYAIVSMADLILTGIYLNPDLESNPAASWIWSQFGYSGIIVFKIFTLFFIIYPCCKVIERKNLLAAKAVLFLGILFTAITCLLFGAFVYG